MAKPDYKTRTRAHVIAELSANHVERFVLNRSHTAERITKDYGYDLVMFTYDANGRAENGYIQIQLKATDRLTVLTDGVTVGFDIERADYNLWIDEPLPVILVVYDARNNVAYWVHVQPVLAALSLKTGQKSIRVHLPMCNVVDEAAIDVWCSLKSNFLARLRQVGMI
jgi:hypothetical protein